MSDADQLRQIAEALRSYARFEDIAAWVLGICFAILIGGRIYKLIKERGPENIP